MAKKLTGKQEKYCQERAKGNNPSDSYRKAYDCKKSKPATINNSAYQLEQNPDITARIKELRAPAIEKINIGLEYTLGVIHETIERCRQSVTPVTVKSDGVEIPTGEFQFDAKAILKGADMLMKHNGGYEKHNRQQVQNSLLVAVGKLPDNLLEAIVEKLNAHSAGLRRSRPDIEGTATRLP